MRIRGSQFLPAILLVFAVILTSVRHTAAEPQPIKFGAVMPITGVFSSAGTQVNDGLRDCIAIANEEGGINGSKLEYIMEDGQYKLEVGKEAFERIMNRDHPMVLFGDSTHLSKALADPIRDKYKILFTSVSFASDVAQAGLYPSIFIPGPTYSDQMGMILRYIAQQAPGAKVAILHSESEFGKDPIRFAEQLIPKMQLQLVSLRAEKIRPTDLDAVVNSFRQADPDYVIVHGFAGGCLTDLVKKCRAANMKCQFMGTVWEVHQKIVDELGPLAQGLLAVSPYSRWWMEDMPMIKRIREYGTKHHPEVKHRPVAYMVGFASGLIFVEVLRKADKAGKLNYDGMVEALKNIKDFDTGGLTAPLTNYNNRFPQARIWKANASAGRLEPESDWTSFRLKRNIEGYQ
jgi:branched-chain amino acid transport system substrate-binding protein